MIQAKNVVEWVTHPEFLGLEHPLWPAQIETLIDIFQEECLACSEHYAERALDDPEVDITTVLLEHGRCPSCGRAKKDVHLVRSREYVGCWGHRTGKSWLTAVAATYQLHRALTRGRLSDYYNIPTSMFCFTFVDPSKKCVWESFLRMWLNSPWQKSLSNEKVSSDSIFYPEQNVIVEVEGKYAETRCRGDIRLFATVDEYDWARLGGFSPAKVRRALINSFRTVESRLPHVVTSHDPLEPKLVLLSSPNFDSKDLATLIRKKYYSRMTSNLPTWAVNPHESREKLIEEYGDSVQFRRDFAAEVPSLASINNF